jgi:phosphoribosylformylglycinamidine cyclo-ligase
MTKKKKVLSFWHSIQKNMSPQINYEQSGVNVEIGDTASRMAYENAKKTFDARNGKIGQPCVIEGGFSGALDMGYYLLVQNDDGVGTKMEIAERMKKYDTIGQDLVAMVADDAICVGAECVSITNTIDVPQVNPEMIQAMTAGLADCCQKEKIIIPGGEIAELSNAVNHIVWNATAVGIVKKDTLITGKSIQPGHKIIGLQGRVLRSNGFSLARKICEIHFGENWHETEWRDGTTWGEILLTPSRVFHRTILENVLGDFEQQPKFPIHGIVHITGGGIPGNVPRVLPPGLGATFSQLHTPHDAVRDLQKIGNLDENECYRTWHCGTAMMLIVDEKNASHICDNLNSIDSEIDATIVGEVINEEKITIVSGFSGHTLQF